MNKKILGIKVSTIFTAFVCLMVSLVVWMLVKYNLDLGTDGALILPSLCALLRG